VPSISRPSTSLEILLLGKVLLSQHALAGTAEYSLQKHQEVN